MNETGDSSENRFIAGRQEWNYGQEYTQARAGEVIELSEWFGLDREFIQPLARYLTDLHLVTSLMARPDNRLELRSIKSGQEETWERVLVLDETDLKIRVALLADILQIPTADKSAVTEPVRQNVLPLFSRLALIDISDDETKQELFPPRTFEVEDLPKDTEEDASAREQAILNSKKLALVAIDWAFYEQVSDIIGGACLMRNTFGKYIHALNDQDPSYSYYRAQYFVSSSYLGRSNGPVDRGAIEEDRERMRNGLGLMKLRDSLIKHDLVSSAKKADWAVQSLKVLHEPFARAFDASAITEHLQSLKPVENVLAGYQRLSESIDPTIDPDAED